MERSQRGDSGPDRRELVRRASAALPDAEPVPDEERYDPFRLLR